MLNAWDRFLLNIHVTGQLSANQGQNLSNKVLAETHVFEASNSYAFLINREFRDLLGLILNYRTAFEDFLRGISESQEEVIAALSECDRDLEEDFSNEITLDLALAANCVALGSA